MLAVHTPDGLRRAVATEDLAALKRVPGIGHKGAQRIVLELGDRLGPVMGTDVGSAAVSAGRGDRRGDVVAALEGLGWNTRTSEDAVATVLQDAGDDPVGAEDVAGVLRASLRLLGASRG